MEQIITMALKETGLVYLENKLIEEIRNLASLECNHLDDGEDYKYINDEVEFESKEKLLFKLINDILEEKEKYNLGDVKNG